MPHTVLLTGATGSLGGRLCAELLDTTQATVHCLVRAGDQQTADRRLAFRMRAFPPAPPGRLVAVPGDIRHPDLGLASADHDALAAITDDIFHCAANVHLAAGYDQVAPVNVGGTRAILALAERHADLTGRPLGLHYVSTLATFIDHHKAGLDSVDETTIPTPATAGPLGYPRSKTEAEALLRRAADEGVIRLTVHRPGLVTAEHATGRTSASDLLVPILRACVAVRAIPTSQAEGAGIDCVDNVARGIVHLALAPASTGRAFHHVQPEPFRFLDAAHALTRAGHRLRSVAPDRWWHLIDEHAAHPAVRPLAAMREVGRYILHTDPDHRSPTIGATTTAAALNTANVPRPALDAAFLDRFVKALQQNGILTP